MPRQKGKKAGKSGKVSAPSESIYFSIKGAPLQLQVWYAPTWSRLMVLLMARLVSRASSSGDANLGTPCMPILTLTTTMPAQCSGTRMLRVDASQQISLCAMPLSSQVLTLIEQFAARVESQGGELLYLPCSRLALLYLQLWHCAVKQAQSPVTVATQLIDFGHDIKSTPQAATCMTCAFCRQQEEEEECTRCWQPTRLNERERWAIKAGFVPCLKVDTSPGFQRHDLKNLLRYNGSLVPRAASIAVHEYEHRLKAGQGFRLQQQSGSVRGNHEDLKFGGTSMPAWTQAEAR